MHITPIDGLLIAAIFVGYCVFRRHDLRRAVYLCFGLVFVGLITINVFERVAAELSNRFPSAAGYFPPAAYVLLFVVGCWILVRVVDRCPESVNAAVIPRCLSGCLSLGSGLLSAAILISALYTVPVSLERFGFAAEHDQRGLLSQRLPVDRLWLEYVQYASGNVFTVGQSQQFRVRQDGHALDPDRRIPFTQRFRPRPPEPAAEDSENTAPENTAPENTIR